MAQLGACTSKVQGDPVYSDGAKYYVITKEKMGREGLKLLTDESKMEEFFNKYADQEMPVGEEVPVKRVGVAAEKK